jgi:hypothetical protein
MYLGVQVHVQSIPTKGKNSGRETEKIVRYNAVEIALTMPATDLKINYIAAAFNVACRNLKP